MDGRQGAVEDDVYLAALLALGHRRRPHPLDTPPASHRSLEEILEQHRAVDAEAAAYDAEPAAGSARDADSASGAISENPEAPERGTPAPDRVVAPSAPTAVLRLHDVTRTVEIAPSGRRGHAANQAEDRGRAIGIRARGMAIRAICREWPCCLAWRRVSAPTPRCAHDLSRSWRRGPHSTDTRGGPRHCDAPRAAYGRTHPARACAHCRDEDDSARKRAVGCDSGLRCSGYRRAQRG